MDLDLSNIDQTIIKKIKKADRLSKPDGVIMKKIKDLFDFSTQNLMNANDLYDEAINSLMILPNPDKTSKIWHLIVELRLCRLNNLVKLNEKQNENYLIYTEYSIIGNILRKYLKNYSSAIKNYRMAIEYCKLTGDMKRIQDIYKTIAEIYDKHLMDYEKSIEYYTHALDADDNSSIHKIYTEIARLNIEIGQFSNAQKNYEKLVEIYIDNKLLEWHVKDVYCMATLCGICIYGLSFESNYKIYTGNATKFNDTLENKLIEGIFESFRKNNVDMFVDTLKEYDKITGKVEPATKLLYHIRKMIEKGCEEDDELL
jgi:tetratricopeptide (TPR) repeat protein